MYGDGSIYKEGKYWIYQYYDGSGKKHRKCFRSEREAKAYKRKTRDEKTAPSAYTLGSWLAEYVERYRMPSLRESSYTRLIQTMTLASTLFGIPLDRISADDIQDLYNSLRRKYASSSIGKLHKLLTAAFRKASSLRMLVYSPMDNVEPIKVSVRKKEIFTFSDILHIYRGLRHLRTDKYKRSLRHDYQLMVTILLTTGMRIGELQALRWEDIDLDRREIHIHQTMSHTGINPPKTPSGDRRVPILHQNLVRKLRSQRSEGFLFQTSAGRPLHYQRILSMWKQIRPKDKTIHTFRHTFATYALSYGIPLLEVSRMLGHSQTSTTVDMYGHSMSTYNQDLLAEIDRRRQKK